MKLAFRSDDYLQCGPVSIVLCGHSDGSTGKPCCTPVILLGAKMLMNCAHTHTNKLENQINPTNFEMCLESLNIIRFYYHVYNRRSFIEDRFNIFLYIFIFICIS